MLCCILSCYVVLCHQSEFKHLVGHAPGGVYLLPHQTDIRQLFGVIFLRKGMYSGGIFRFKVTLPPDYNTPGSFPSVVFTPPIFHPLVHSTVG
jgi:ubiquitin-protein ligase